MRLIEFYKVMLSQQETSARISKLVDRVKESLRLFAVAAETTPDADFRQLAAEIRNQLDQYAFELQTEIERLGGEHCGFTAMSFSLPESEPIDRRCETSLQATLEEFLKALQAPLTAHARAMIRRQHAEVDQAYKQFVAWRRVA